MSMPAQGQASYSGMVGTAPIELVLEAYSDGLVTAAYAYTKYDTPIALEGTLRRDLLVLAEKTAQGKASATLMLPTFSTAAKTAVGTWKNLLTGQELPITLTQQFVVEEGEGKKWDHKELLQARALKGIYFKAVLTKQPDDFTAGVTEIKLFEKKTDRLVQKFAVECQLQGLHNVAVGDFNFDGLEDFSVYEHGAAGPNTTSLYFLYDPATKRYVQSSFSGTSLEFDAKKRRIYERNSCCAGSQVTTAEYKVVNNRMVLVAQHCYTRDEKKQDLVERKLSACQ